ncbi:MAG: hypothetical protein ACK5V3_07485, partial [Bdellovibrionales bacterium]
DLDETIFKAINPGNLSRSKLIWSQIERLQKLECPHTGSRAKQWKGKRSQIVGKKFENLISYLFENSKVFSVSTNISTESSEIDLLIELGMMATKIPFLNGAGSYIIGEAKCHSEGPKTQWVARLRGLMETHSTSRSFLIAGCTPRTVHRKIRAEISLNAAQNKVVVLIGT